jgi:hypothetical protein
MLSPASTARKRKVKENYEKKRIVVLILPETHIQTLHANFCISLRRREELGSSDPGMLRRE